MVYPDTRLVTVSRIFDGMPDFVRDTTPVTEKIASEFDDEVFADTSCRKYPLNDKPGTWLAAAMFQVQKQAGELDMDNAKEAWVWHRIKQAADAYGVDTDDIVNQVEAALAEKHAENYGVVYALEVKDDHGNVYGRSYPISDARGVKMASEYFAKHERQYPVKLRLGIAQKIAEQAGRFNVNLANTPEGMRVLKYNADSIIHRPMMVHELEKRASRIENSDKEFSHLIRTTARMIASAPISELQANREKLASIMDRIDVRLGISGMYGMDYKSPEDAAFGLGFKEAAELKASHVELAGYAFSAEKLASLDPHIAFEPVLGKEAVDKMRSPVPDSPDVYGYRRKQLSIAKVANELSELPPPMQKVLVEHLQRVYP